MALILTLILFMITGRCKGDLSMTDLAKQTISSCPGYFTATNCKSNGTLDRSCDCDLSCAWKNSCCYDAPAYDKELARKYSDRNITCMKGKRMLIGCDEGWGQDEIQELCEAADPNSFSESRDPLLHLPVTSKVTGVVYSNYYCAICNTDANDVIVLDYKFSCHKQQGVERLFQSILLKVLGAGADGYKNDYDYDYGHEYVNDFYYSDDNNSDEYCLDCGIRSQTLNITYEGLEAGWLTTLNAGSDYLHFKCDTIIDQNYDCECSNLFDFDIIEKCDVNWKGEEVEDLCKSYRGLVIIGGNIYKNVFCAICNFMCISDSCYPISEDCSHEYPDYEFTFISGSSTITKTHSSSMCKVDEDFFPGYCHAGDNKLLCALSSAYHRYPICVKKDRGERIRSYLARKNSNHSLDEKGSETTSPSSVHLNHSLDEKGSETTSPSSVHLKSYTLLDFVNQTLTSCPGQFDCKSNFSYRQSCDCDEDCARRSTCCYDAPAAYDKALIKKNLGKTRCSLNKAIFFECDDEWEGDEILNLCKAAGVDSVENSKDPLLHIPVTSNKTQITYANHYCAMCNNDAEEIIMWDYSFSCLVEKSLESVLQDILDTEADENWANMIWAADSRAVERNEHYGYECRNINDYMGGNHWKIRLNNTDIECQLHLNDSASQDCCQEQFELIEKCADNWNDNEVKDLCQSFKGQVVIKENKYRNVFCAICNHEYVSPADNLCMKSICNHEYVSPADNLFMKPFISPANSLSGPLTLLYDIKKSALKESKSTCKSDEQYIPGPCSGGKHSFLCQKSNASHKSGICIKRKK